MIPETISRQNVDGESRVVEETVRAESATRAVETATTDSAAAHEQGRTGSEKTLSRWRPLPSPSSELLEEDDWTPAEVYEAREHGVDKITRADGEEWWS